MIQKEKIDVDDVQAFVSVSAAAERLKAADLADTTGIIDASVKGAMDRLGMDLDDKVLTQSANYNLIVNSLARAAFGSQVTGNELDRLKAQMGTEFRADNTVVKKMAETLANVATKFDALYKVKAPATYAAVIRDRVDTLRTMVDQLRNPEGPEKKVYKGVIYIKNEKTGMWEEDK